jgi:tetratricopeptide (TPR) repeat protein
VNPAGESGVDRAVRPLAVILALLSIAGAASAQEETPTARAQRLFTEGVAAYEAGRLDEAVQRLREADGIVHSPELSFNIARVYERMGEAREAIQWFQRYLRESNPTPEERAQIEARIAAMRALEQRMRDQVMTLPPTDDEMTQEARTFFERGVAMFRRRRYDAALQAFTAAYNFARLPEVVYNLAVASERTDHTQDAIDYYREYLRARPDDPARRQIERHVEELRAQQRRD